MTDLVNGSFWPTAVFRTGSAPPLGDRPGASADKDAKARRARVPPFDGSALRVAIRRRLRSGPRARKRHWSRICRSAELRAATARCPDPFAPARVPRATEIASLEARAASRSVACACVRWLPASAARNRAIAPASCRSLASDDFTSTCASFTQTASAVSRVLVAVGLILSEAERVRSRPSWRAFTRHIGLSAAGRLLSSNVR